MLLQRRGEALAAFEAVLERDPEREAVLAWAGTLAEDLRRWEQARAYWGRAVAVNPWMPAYRRHRVQVLLQFQSWDEAAPEIRDWLRLDPCSLDARKAWIASLLHEGKQDEARAEFARIEALSPPDLAQWRAWFAQQTR
jgi:tetratricopeptide (TPR) repeat protein